MKATSFQKPFEYSLRVDGEAWSQGEAVIGTLDVKNHGGPPPEGANLQVHLGRASLKEVRNKSADAFNLLASASTEGWTFPESGQSASYPFRFDLDRNAPVTDSTTSLFLLYGHSATQEALGQIQLKVVHEPVVAQVLETFNVQFRFVLKTQRASKQGVESKLSPPDSKQFSSLEHLMLTSRFEEDTLQLKYVFHVKKLEPHAAGVTTVKSKVEAAQEWPAIQYRTASGRWNHEYIEGRIQEALQALESSLS